MFSENCISSLGWGEFSNLWCLDYWGNEFVSQKLKVKIFSHVRRENFAQGSYHHLREITQSPRQCFFLKTYSPIRNDREETVIMYWLFEKDKQEMLSCRQNFFMVNIRPCWLVIRVHAPFLKKI